MGDPGQAEPSSSSSSSTSSDEALRLNQGRHDCHMYYVARLTLRMSCAQVAGDLQDDGKQYADEAMESEVDMEEDPLLAADEIAGPGDRAPSAETRELQSRRFWALECEMRTRCLLTSTEMMQLGAVSNLLAGKVKDNPLDPGNHVPKVWLWQQLVALSEQGALRLNVYTSLSQQTPEWTLAKLCLLQQRSQDRAAGRQLLQCYCLPATAFMPCGCLHDKAALGYGYKGCLHCSMCLRCGQICKQYGGAGARCICTSAAMSPECEDIFLH